jgi:aspartate aminotransferase
MSKGFSKRSTAVSPSLTLAITAKANELKSRGVDVVSFGVGEPDFNTPENIINAAKYALDNGMTKYTASSGMPILKKAICQKLKDENGLEYEPSQIVVSTGAKQALFNALQVLVDEGDEVILPAPYWLTYPELVKICGGTVKLVYCLPENDFILNPADLEKAITPKTKAIILNTPNNPTGAVYSKENIEKIAEILAKYPDIWVISDEIYEKLIYDGVKHYSIANVSKDIYDRTIVINGMSKAYAMTGWRIGYAAAPSAQVAKLMDGLQSHQTSNANTMAQYASMVALTDPTDNMEKMRVEFEARRNMMLELIADIKDIKAVRPTGAFYIMIDVSKLFNKTYEGEVVQSAHNLAKMLIDNESVAVIPCEGFGTDNFIRLSYATSRERIKEGLTRIKNFINKLK